MFKVNNIASEKSEAELNSINVNEVNNILLVGNGFDLAVGLKTSYSDFVKFLAIKIYLSNIKEFIKNHKEYKSWIKDCLSNNNILDEEISLIFSKAIDDLNTSKTEFFKYDDSNSLLKNPFMCDFFKLVLGEDICEILQTDSFVTTIPKLSDSYLQVKKHIKINSSDSHNDDEYVVIPKVSDEDAFDARHDLIAFANATDQMLQNSSLKQWLDVESFIEFLVTNDKDLSTRFYPDTSNYISPLFANPSLYKEYFAGIEHFCNHFKEYLCSVLNGVFVKFSDGTHRDTRKVFENFNEGFVKPYSKSFVNRTHGYLRFSEVLNINEIINYNYTYAAEAYFYLCHLYEIYNHTYHVNGELDYDSHYNIHEDKANSNHLVFGFSNTKSQELKSTFHAFEKKVLRVIKNTTPLDLDKLTSKPFNLLIYGHSCGVADGDVIGKLLKSSELQIAVVLCLDQISLVSITNNLIEIIGQKRFDTLIRNANQKLGKNSLYFAVRNESFGNTN